MDGSDVHTSVVIELANQEELEDKKMYKIEEVETPKDYVIDQIFCGENITVYALFEISDVTNRKTDKLLEVTGSQIDDYRFYHRNSYKKAINENRFEERKASTTYVGSEDSLEVLSKKTQKDRSDSFYCLKHLCSNYETSNRGDENLDMKVLYSKDIIHKAQKSTKFKAVSKGVNTDIVQSPKLLEEVQQAVTVNFPFGKLEGKHPVTSNKPSYDLLELETRLSCSSSDLENKKNGKKTSPNFLFVPLIMMEEGTLNKFWKEDRNQNAAEEKGKEAEGKISLGVNTDVECIEVATETKPEKSDEVSTSESQSEKTKSSESQTSEPDISEKLTLEGKNLGSKVTLLKNNKEAILDEIKSLQWKLNVLVKSLESKHDKLNVSESSDCETKAPEAKESILNNEEEKPSEDIPAEEEVNQMNQKKCVDLPAFSTVFSSQSKIHKMRKLSAEDRKDGLSRSMTTLVSVSECQNEENKAKVLKESLRDAFINWDASTKHWKGLGVSKSQVNNRLAFTDKRYVCFHGIKRSLSLDLRDEKTDNIGFKKMKNLLIKLEGNSNQKANVKIYQEVDNTIASNLTSLKCEMGDEMTNPKRPTNPKSNLTLVTEKPEGNFEVKSNNQNEEEGDAKMFSQKNRLVQPKFLQNHEKLSAHFYSASTTKSDGILKNEKNLAAEREKSRTVDKSVERRPKGGSDSEKPTTPNKTQRRSSISDVPVKKDSKINKKIEVKTKTLEKPTKLEKKVLPSDPKKQKSLPRSVKSTMKGTVDSKLHPDKRKCENDEAGKLQTKSGLDEKSKGKSEPPSLLSRPPSQKRDRRDAVTTSRDKETCQKKSGILSQKTAEVSKHPEGTTLSRENVDHIMVFEKKKSNKAITKNQEVEATENLLAANPSSIVVELFSKKPTTAEEFYSEVSKDSIYLKNDTFDGNTEEKIITGSEETSDDGAKPIVKSVWALTKVLLYEDGTKKFEVLEASLSPPGYTLKNEMLPDKSKN